LVLNGFENRGVSDGIFPSSDTSRSEGYAVADFDFSPSPNIKHNAVQSLVNDRTFPHVLMSVSSCLSFRDCSAFTDNLAHILMALGVRSASKQKQKEAMEKIKALAIVTENC
jgi:hypothetical protein